jgi:hypothetical protein
MFWWIVGGLLGAGAIANLVFHWVRGRKERKKLDDLLALSEDRASDIQVLLLQEQKQLHEDLKTHISKELNDAYDAGAGTDLDDTIRRYSGRIQAEDIPPVDDPDEKLN